MFTEILKLGGTTVRYLAKNSGYQKLTERGCAIRSFAAEYELILLE